MKKAIGLSLLLISLTACGANGINKDDPEGSAKYIKKELSLEGDIKETQEEYYQGVVDVYSIREDTEVVASDDNTIEQINFSNVDEKDIEKILNMIDFPEVESINELTEKYYMDIAKYGEPEDNSTFTSYENVGVSVSTTMDILKDEGDKPFTMSLIYNTDRFDKFRETNLK